VIWYLNFSFDVGRSMFDVRLSLKEQKILFLLLVLGFIREPEIDGFPPA